jgi:hypothetical protein
LVVIIPENPTHSKHFEKRERVQCMWIFGGCEFNKRFWIVVKGIHQTWEFVEDGLEKDVCEVMEDYGP